MATPRSVSRSKNDPHGVLPWNAMVDLCAMEPLDNCTPTQRKAALLFWYQAEVSNGGHFQYFLNKSNYPHEELLTLLRELGAPHSAAVFAAALQQVSSRLPLAVEEREDYDLESEELNLLPFDIEWGSKSNKEIEACLLRLLREEEGEFVEWQA